MKVVGYLSKCKTKGCKHATRSDTEGCGTCPEHGRYWLEPIWGEHVASIRCGAACQNATGPSCDCSCGGLNHGHNHA